MKNMKEKYEKYEKVYALVKTGVSATDACKELGVRRSNFYHWKSKFIHGKGAPAKKADNNAQNAHKYAYKDTPKAFTVQVPLTTQKYPVVFMDMEGIRELMR